jgi:predicted aspartyl protease
MDMWRTLYRTASPQGQPEPLPADTVEIPLRTTTSGFLSGEVKIDGLEGTHNFIIDTGASISVVSEKLASEEALASYVQPTRLRVFGAAGVADDVKTLTLPNLMLGTIARKFVNAAVLDLEPVNETAGFSQDGILGGNFLRHYRISFDFQRGLIRLEPVKKTARIQEAVPD